ncbi:MAG: hypothetical protein Q9208_006105 [Pyrenodesmia sp. 3 TL-2023]
MYNTVSVEGLNALLWTLTSLAILLSAGRFAIRYATAGRFHWDDASHLVSLLLLIGLAATYTSGFPYSVRIARINRKEEEAPPLTDPFYHTYLQLRLTVTLLVFMVLWSVKATFLIFYRLLFSVSRLFMLMWWAAVALTFATFWVCIGSTFTLCGSASDLYDFKKCSSPKALQDIRTTYKYWCALNVGTDLVVAIVDILRTVESLESGTFSGVALWSSLEVTVAVIVASLPLYRALLTSKGRNSLLSRLSGERYKDVDSDGSPAGTERKFLEANTISHSKPAVSTFREDLETQNSEFSKYAGRGQQVPFRKPPK